MKNNKKMMLVLVAALSLITIAPLTSEAQVNASVQYTSPAWAPPYYAGVRYYYLPDIEAYYDLTDNEFVYLDNGQWEFSPALPAMYSNYDLNDAFVVALDVNVYKPWLHQAYYLSHYPRYYHLNFYGKGNIRGVRGFNENGRKPFYRTEAGNARISEVQKTGITDHRVEAGRPPEALRYDGRNIGRPVRVTRDMRESRGRR
jgi:hypothetical protein